jgi:hypothetical protein
MSQALKHAFDLRFPSEEKAYISSTKRYHTGVGTSDFFSYGLQLFKQYPESCYLTFLVVSIGAIQPYPKINAQRHSTWFQVEWNQSLLLLVDGKVEGEMFPK